jgi:phosphatidylinositol-3-phosphatase
MNEKIDVSAKELVRNRVAGFTLVAVLTLGLLSCGSDARQLPAQTTRAPQARVARGAPAHIAVIVMENEEYRSVIGSSSTPFINRLARNYGLASSAYAISHPSLPNYLALTGGSTFSISSDCTDCSVPGAGLVGQLAAKRISWKAYMEDLPRRCFTGSGHDNYAKKHDPFVYYTSVVRNPGLCARVVPLTQIRTDERSRALPRFIWITPNLCHDMHDCSTATGDRFLAGAIPPLLRSLGPRSLLILTWDEGDSDNGCCRFASGGHIATIVAGSLARRHARLRTPVDHYSVLQTIEDLFGLHRLRGAACRCTQSLQPLLRRR